MEKNHYVDNDQLREALIERQRLNAIAEESGEEPPRVTEYIGKCIFDICNKLSYMPRFIGYSYREEMIGDAIEKCLKAVDNYDEEKSPRAFSYFTTIAYWEFVKRIEREKDQRAVKAKLLYQLPEDDLIEYDDETGETNNFIDVLRDNYYFDIDEYDRKKKEKARKTKEKARQKKLEEFMEDDLLKSSDLEDEQE